MRKYSYCIMVIIITALLAFTGCVAQEVAETVTDSIPSVSAALALTEAPTPSPSPTPNQNPSSTPSSTPSVISTLSLPDVEGLTLKDSTYYYGKNNPYGGKEGDYAGEYKKNVFLDNIETGGIALVPLVAEKVLNDALNDIPAGSPRIKVALPMDIAQAGNENVTIQCVTGGSISFIKINCNKDLPILWIVPGSEILRLGISPNSNPPLDFIFDVRNWQYKEDEDSNSENFSYEIFPLQDGEYYKLENNPMTNDNMMLFLSLQIENGVLVKTYGSQMEGIIAHVQADINNNPNLFGWSAYDDIRGLGKSVSIYCHESTRAVEYALTVSDILMIGNTPVFLTSVK